MTSARRIVVTGYVPIADHPRSERAYHRLGAQLGGLSTPVHVCRSSLDETWLHQQVLRHTKPVTHSVGDNPKKNTLAYHCVQHQKTAWMLEAARAAARPDVVVWLDYGIFHQPGVTVEAIDAFLSRVDDEPTIAIPGCWKQAVTAEAIDLANPCWRFCGSTLICHRSRLEALDVAIREDVIARLNTTSHVSWEVNTWARVELGATLPIRWYRGDHNQTQFTEYTA